MPRAGAQRGPKLLPCWHRAAGEQSSGHMLGGSRTPHVALGLRHRHAYEDWDGNWFFGKSSSLPEEAQ